MPGKPAPARYQPLAAYLAAQPAARVTLTFAQIEAVIAGALPAGAYRRSWWLRSYQPQTLVWRSVGWQVVAADLWNQTITFAQHGAAEEQQASSIDSVYPKTCFP